MLFSFNSSAMRIDSRYELASFSGFTAAAAVPHRTDSMNDVARLHPAGGGGDCLPGGQRTALLHDSGALLPDGGPAGAVNGAADAAPGRKLFVGGVDDGVGVLQGDIAREERDGAAAL